jgi:hypothetical protein
MAAERPRDHSILIGMMRGVPTPGSEAKLLGIAAEEGWPAAYVAGGCRARRGADVGVFFGVTLPPPPKLFLAQTT